MKILTADFVLPVSAPPFEGGAVVVDNDKIAAVGTLAEIQQKFPEAAIENFGKSVIMPGLVNCHSHLEITAMRGFLDSSDDDFYAWLIKLTETRGKKLTERDIEITAILGALEGARAGVTCFGDIGRYGKAGFKALKANGLRGILFQETEFSPDNETAQEDFDKLKEKFLALRQSETGLVKVGLSPHAPYTVSRRLFEKIAEYSIAENIKITIHAAESGEEQDLMRKGAGFFAEVYKNYDYQWHAPFCSSIEYLDIVGILQAKPLLAHCVKVSARDIGLIALNDAKVAHCPKSNSKFGHGIAPLENFLDRKISVGFGSDSVASNNVCDILEEARFAVLLARTRDKRKRFIFAREAIETATLGGAKALGLENEIGSLEAGKQADLIVVSLGEAAQQPNGDINSTLLFSSNGRDINLTMVAGEEIFRGGRAVRIDDEALFAEIKKIGRKLRQ